MNESRLLKQINYLKLHAVLSTTIIFGLVVFQLSSIKNKGLIATRSEKENIRLKYIAVERLDVVEPNGNVGISLSNSKRTPLPSWDGQVLKGASNRDSPNIIFFDGKGDEVGGINFSNNHNNGNAVRHFAFDGYKQDEVMAFSHFIQNGKSRTGLYIYNRPDINILASLKEMGISSNDIETQLRKKLLQFKKTNPVRFSEIWYDHKRLALQTNNAKEAELILADEKGQTRLRFSVSKLGRATIDFLDGNGNVVKQIDANQKD